MFTYLRFMLVNGNRQRCPPLLLSQVHRGLFFWGFFFACNTIMSCTLTCMRLFSLLSVSPANVRPLETNPMSIVEYLTY